MADYRRSDGEDIETPVGDDQSQRARDIRAGLYRTNPDGTHSSHLMASVEMDGRHYAVPTLFPTESGGWRELPINEAVAEAKRRGEVFSFESKEEADAFASGSWKENMDTYDKESTLVGSMAVDGPMRQQIRQMQPARAISQPQSVMEAQKKLQEIDAMLEQLTQQRAQIVQALPQEDPDAAMRQQIRGLRK